MESKTTSAGRFLRAIPFVAGTALSLFVAGRAPDGRRPFFLDLDLSMSNLRISLVKIPHYGSMTGIFLLAILATGMERAGVAFGLTVLVGAAWELAEATAIGHTGRLADLVPDLIAAVACLAFLNVTRSAMNRRSRQSLPVSASTYAR